MPVEVVPLPPEVQKYVYGVVPPLAEATAAPSFPPKQETLEVTVADKLKVPELFTVDVDVVLQPVASVTVKV